MKLEQLGKRAGLGQPGGDQLEQLDQGGVLGLLSKENLVQLHVGQLLGEVRVVGVQLEQLTLLEGFAGG